MDPEIVAGIPEGHWASYGDVARAAGGRDQHARALNQRFIRFGQDGAHRVLKSDGTVGRQRAGRPGRTASPRRPRSRTGQWHPVRGSRSASGQTYRPPRTRNAGGASHLPERGCTRETRLEATHQLRHLSRITGIPHLRSWDFPT